MSNSNLGETCSSTKPPAQLLLYRITLELASPLAIGSGASDDVFDAPCARDANGLPTIPGTSLAGALRSLWVDQNGADSAKDWFGMITPGTDEGTRSRLLFTWAHLHDQTNQPVEGLMGAQTIQNDAVLTKLVRLPHRDHVRLSHRGGAADTAKFDRSFVPTGCRFTFDLRLFTSADKMVADREAVFALLQLCWTGQLWLGGAKASGYGRTKVVSVRELDLDLTKDAARKFMANMRSLKTQMPRPQDGDGVQLKLIKKAVTKSGNQRVNFPLLDLHPRDTWRVGSGVESVAMQQNGQNSKNLANALPYTEACLNWSEPKANEPQSIPKWQNEIVVPGSTIRGALAHRTAFHFNRLQKRWTSNSAIASAPTAGTNPVPIYVVEVLFGSAKVRQPGANAAGNQAGFAGAVFVDDIHILIAGAKVVRLPHVRIDRFTGGAFRGALFSEELLFHGDLPLQLSIDKTRLQTLAKAYGADMATMALKALEEALRDLCEQRLPIGAGGAHGHGYCTATWPSDAVPFLQTLMACLPTPALNAHEEVNA